MLLSQHIIQTSILSINNGRVEHNTTQRNKTQNNTTQHNTTQYCPQLCALNHLLKVVIVAVFLTHVRQSNCVPMLTSRLSWLVRRLPLATTTMNLILRPAWSHTMYSHMWCMPWAFIPLTDEDVLCLCESKNIHPSASPLRCDVLVESLTVPNNTSGSNDDDDTVTHSNTGNVNTMSIEDMFLHNALPEAAVFAVNHLKSLLWSAPDAPYNVTDCTGRPMYARCSGALTTVVRASSPLRTSPWP